MIPFFNLFYTVFQSVYTVFQSGYIILKGSEFDRGRAAHPRCGDVEPGYVELKFYSALTVFERDPRGGWIPADTAPMEAALVLIPIVLREPALPTYRRMFERAIRKSVTDSLWIAQRDKSIDTYREHGLTMVVKCFTDTKRKRASSNKLESPAAEDGAGDAPERQADAS